MPPRKRQTKEEKAVAQLAKMLAKLGVQDVPTVIPEQEPDREAEAVLQFLEAPKTFRARECKRAICHNMFSSNYKGVAYCSNACRALDLASMGIKWDPYKDPEQRWGGEPPLVIGAEAMQKLIELAAQTGIPISEAKSSSQNQIEILSETPSVFSAPVQLHTSADQILPSYNVSEEKNLEEPTQALSTHGTTPRERENISPRLGYSVFQFQSIPPKSHNADKPDLQ